MINLNRAASTINRAAPTDDLLPFAREIRTMSPPAAAEASSDAVVLDLALEERSVSAFLLDDEDVLEIN